MHDCCGMLGGLRLISPPTMMMVLRSPCMHPELSAGRGKLGACAHPLQIVKWSQANLAQERDMMVLRSPCMQPENKCRAGWGRWAAACGHGRLLGF